MAWEWSHTLEAVSSARKNFESIAFHDLCVIAAEWDADKKADEFDFNLYAQKFKEYEARQSININDLWDKIESQRLSDNGGFNAWVCPYGCHTVPFNDR